MASILVKFKTVKSMALVSFFIMMVECLKENLKMILKMARVINNFQMGLNIQENFNKELKMEKEHLNGRMDKFMKGNG